MATIKGTNRDDILYGTASDDTIDAYDGNNFVYAGNGNNRVTAGSGNDTITAGTGNDTIDAGNGNNVIDAGDGRNAIATGSGNDTITSGVGDDTIDAGDGDNRITAGAGNNRITTGRGADIIYAGSGNDTIKAGEGNNFIDAGNGTNWISAGAGNDQIITGAGADTIISGHGANVINAGNGDNDVTAGSGNDTITTGSGRDCIDAGEGDNVVNAGDGNNDIETGSGSDTIAAGDGADCIDAGDGTNTIDAGNGNNDIRTGWGNDRITSGHGSDDIWAGNGVNIIDAGNGNNSVVTGDGADRVKSGSGSDCISTGAGNDFVDAGAGNDQLYLDGGNDTVRHDIAANKTSCDIYWGGSGTDTLQLVLTVAQVADPAIQADIARFNATGGGNLLGFFCFNSMNLTTWSFEKIVIVAPVDAIDDVTTVGEDATVVINVLGNDKDLGAVDNSALRVTGFDASGLPGSLTLNANGTFTYLPGAAYQSLGVGQTAVTSFTYTISDDQGFSDTATVSITVTGANDAPVFAPAPATGEVVEGGAVSTSGTIAFTDVDAIDTHVVSFMPTGTGYLGTFTATKATDSTGGATGQVSWSFNVAPAAIAFLNAGQTLTQTYQVKVDDGKGGVALKDVVVTIVGTNGPPVANADVATTGENAPVTISVLNNDSDPDGDTLTVTGVSAPSGKGTATTNGTSITFNPGTAFDHLAVGQAEIVILSYSVSDGKGGTASSNVAVTVTGANDAPVVTGPVSASTTEDGAPVALNALLNASDVDDGTTLSIVVFGPLPSGVSYDAGTQSFVFDPADPAYQSLAQGQRIVLSVGYGVTDGLATTPAIAQWTVIGTNDAPVVTGTVFGSATEDGATVALNAIANASDVDAGQTPSVVVPTTLPAGVSFDGASNSFVLDPADPAYQSLPLGDTIVVTVSYGVTDGIATTAAMAQWTVTGTNDTPVAVADTGTTAENQILTLDVLANDTDVDTGSVFTLTAVAAPAGKGSASIVDNKLVFSPGTAFDHLKVGAIETVVVSYTMRDENGASSSSTATILVTGANDAPVAVADVATTTENLAVAVDVLANDLDVDDAAVFTLIAVATPPGKGSASIVDNKLVFAPGTDFDHLAAGASEQVSVAYTVQDEFGATSSSVAVITVDGANDAPVVTGTVEAFAIEGGSPVPLNPLAFASDVDDGATLSIVQPGTLPPGVSFDAGLGLFVLDPSVSAYQSLAQGQATVVTISYGVTDGVATTPATAQWTVTGTNDAPVVTGTVTGTATEDGAVVALDALANASDVDDGATLSVVVPGTLPAGVSFDAATSSFVLDPSVAAYQSLAQGQTTVVRVDYAVSDGTASAPASVAWTVSGALDPFVIGPPQAGAVTEDGAPASFDALAGASTIDQGTTLHVTPPATLPAGVSYDAATRSFTIDPGAAVFQSLEQGEQTIVVVNYTIDDGGYSPIQNSSVSWTVTGVNDAPVANPVDGKVSGGSAKVNLMLVLDLSGSMDENVTGGTRLTAAKVALNNLITLYDTRGDVAIRLVGFGDRSIDVAGRWLTVAEARAEIAAFLANGSTDYDTAVVRARQAFLSGDGRIADGQNVSYFLSDGEPNQGTNLPNTAENSAGGGLNSVEEKLWTDFLNVNKINSFALGIGTGLTASSVNFLNPIAYNGITGTNTNGVLVPDVNNLSAVLAATANAPVTGNLLTSATPQGSFGPDDDGYVQQIVIAGTTFTLDYANNTVTSSGPRAYSYAAATYLLSTTDQNGGALTINLQTGDYSFTVPNNSALGAPSAVGFTLADLYGATASSILSLSNDGVRDDRVITNFVGTVSIDKAALLANDVDQSGAAISIASVANEIGGTATLGASTVSFAMDPAVNPGTFRYTGTSSTGSDAARVTVDHSQAGNTTINGTAAADIIILSAAGGAANVIAGDGNDLIFGSAATDTFTFDTSDGFDKITDGSTLNRLLIAGTGDLERFEVRTLPPTGPTPISDLVFSMGDTVVQVVNANVQNIIGFVQFEPGATVYGATLAGTYGISPTSGMGLIVRPTTPTTPTATSTSTGTALADIIYGGTGRDLLNGNGGDDILIGGEGADVLTGGAGRDVFVFLSATDTNSTPANPINDTIADFEQGLDKISLSAIDASTTLAGDQAFSFVAAPTTAAKAFSVTWSQVDANSVIVRGDVDGDSIADFTIEINSLAATFSPTSFDFIL